MTQASPLVQEHMTWIPHTVDVGQPISAAWQRMHTLGIGHLPVIEEGRLVGMLSEREIDMMLARAEPGSGDVPVGDVMRTEVCSVPPDAPLASAVRDMADQKADCCAILDRGRLVGILTATDAMRLLTAVLSEHAGPGDTGLRPSEVRERILSEHEVLRNMFEGILTLAREIGDEEAGQDVDAHVEAALRQRARELFLALLRHIGLEDKILAPALVQTDGFGPVRAQQLLTEHQHQRTSFVDALDPLDALSALELARMLEQMIESLRADMRHEEQALLDPDLLRDDVIEVMNASD